MNRCPSCNQPASLARLLVMTRRRPYRCPACREVARLLPRHHTSVTLLTVGLVVFCLAFVLRWWGPLGAALAFAELYIGIIGGIMLFLCRMTPLITGRR